jgi:hypothetical protein
MAGTRAPVLRWRCEWKLQRRVAVFGERSFGYHVWQPQSDGKTSANSCYTRNLLLNRQTVLLSTSYRNRPSPLWAEAELLERLLCAGLLRGYIHSGGGFDSLNVD